MHTQYVSRIRAPLSSETQRAKPVGSHLNCFKTKRLRSDPRLLRWGLGADGDDGFDGVEDAAVAGAAAEVAAEADLDLFAIRRRIALE